MINGTNEPKFKKGEVILYQNGNRFELGIVKKVIPRLPEDLFSQDYFVNYHTGDTAARTPEYTMHKLVNAYAFDIRRLTPDERGNTIKELFDLLDNGFWSCEPKELKDLEKYNKLRKLLLGERDET